MEETAKAITKKWHNNQWYSIKRRSLAIYARTAGFDLSMYEDYSKEVQAELRKRAVTAAMGDLESECEDRNFPVGDIKRGVYIISLSNPFAIQYEKHRSQVIYIGRGNIMGRVKSHFQLKLFDFMLSLNGAEFDFHFANPTSKGPDPAKTCVQIEHLMLDYFFNQYGSFPILNKNAGHKANRKTPTDWWKEHLKAFGPRAKWALKPTKHGEFPALDS